MCAPVIDNTPSLASSTKARSHETNPFRVTASSSGEEKSYCKPRRSRTLRNDILLLENASAMIAEARSRRKESCSTEPSACDMALHNLFRRRKRASSRSSFQPKNSNNTRPSKATYNWDSCIQYYSELKNKSISRESVYCERNGKHNGHSELERFARVCEEALDTREERIEDRKHQYMMIRKRRVSFDFNLKGPGHVHNDKHEQIKGILRKRE
ncbi:predicted protein [Chaetoceros tenuissimus]|uniref:Uncharacterized protein n=1 Tax=Chaetoceros tenuissimus TaxID=426638 RepID=A0AAD3H453_9STRA|nr:predicted protein [Chaetoceros tenuissimus]